jgi:hypothetical protein
MGKGDALMTLFPLESSPLVRLEIANLELGR